MMTDNNHRHAICAVNKQFLFFILTLIFSLNSFGQTTHLQIIEPHIGFTPFLVENFKNELKEIDNIIDNQGYEYLTEQQRSLYERNEETAMFFEKDDWYNCSWVYVVNASSALKPFGNIDYKAQNIHDFNFETAWVEGVKGYGIGESITYRFPYWDEDISGEKMSSDIAVTNVIIFNGYLKSYRAWRDNSRVKQLKLYINGEPYALLNLQDTIAMQVFNIGNHSSTTDLYMTFEITDVYKGNKYDDTAISELEFDGTGCLCFAKGTVIAVPDGEKPIEELTVGDTVLTLNTETGKVETATVAGLQSRKHFVYELDFGEIKIKTTEDHPFYFDGKYYSVAPNNTYGITTQAFSTGQNVNFLNGKTLGKITLKGIKKLDGYETTYTITKLNKNSLFFANGICVATEETVKCK
ncbi:MAG: Hint domain-containing protein [Prevotellaceae bacterium]|jgi:hypothetical protein|nr:Hint domain-containing protein [Prevotellaceae bacterium]